MPTYEYICHGCGKVDERILRLKEYATPQFCGCGHEEPMMKVILTAPMGFVQQDIHYQSPVTGEVITSKAKREQDLAKHGCVEYDPGMKQDYQRRIADEEARIEKSVDQTVDQFFDALPARKKEKLLAEVAGGADVTPVRQTVEA